MSHFIHDNMAILESPKGEYFVFVKGGYNNVRTRHNRKWVRDSAWNFRGVYESREDYAVSVAELLISSCAGGSYQFGSLKNKNFKGFVLADEAASLDLLMKRTTSVPFSVSDINSETYEDIGKLIVSKLDSVSRPVVSTTLESLCISQEDLSKYPAKPNADTRGVLLEYLDFVNFYRDISAREALSNDDFLKEMFDIEDRLRKDKDLHSSYHEAAVSIYTLSRQDAFFRYSYPPNRFKSFLETPERLAAYLDYICGGHRTAYFANNEYGKLPHLFNSLSIDPKFIKMFDDYKTNTQNKIKDLVLDIWKEFKKTVLVGGVEYKVEDFISPLSSRIENKNIPSSLLEALVEVERFISDLSYEISGQQRILKDFTEKVEPLILEGMFNDVDFRSESLRSLRESYQHKKDNVVSDFLSLWRDIPKYSYYKETRTILPGHINSLLAAKENLGEAWNSEEIVDKCMYLEGGCSRGMLFCHKNQMKKNVGAVEDAMNTLYDEFRPMLEKQGVIEKWEAAVPSFQEHISKFSDYTPTTYVLNEFSGGNVNKALRRCIENRGIDQKPTDETPSVKVSI